MKILISPAKRLNETSDVPSIERTQHVFMEQTQQLVKHLKTYKERDIQKLMKLSDTLASLNYHRYQDFTCPFTPQNTRPALFMFQGDVYDKLDVKHYTPDQLTFTNTHVRILSGLYGLLKPFDMMQPYRLEMGTKLKIGEHKNLYEFWGERITNQLNAEESDTIINLASQEYFKAIQPKNLKSALIHIDFKHLKKGEMKTLGMLAKQARGAMLNWIIKNNITKPQPLFEFKEDGYSFQPDLSDKDRWVFIKHV